MDQQHESQRDKSDTDRIMTEQIQKIDENRAIEYLQQKLRDSQTKAATFKQQINMLIEKIQRMKVQQDAAESRGITQVKLEKSKVENENAQLKNSLDQLKLQIQENENVMSNLRLQISSSQQACNRKEYELQSLQSNFEQLKQLRQNQEQKYEQKIHQVDSEYNEQVQRLQQELSQKTTELEQAREIKNELSLKCECAQKQQITNEKNYAIMVERNKQNNEFLVSTQNEKYSLQEQLRQAQIQLQKQNIEINQYKDALEQQKSQVSKLQLSVEQSASQSMNLTKQSESKYLIQQQKLTRLCECSQQSFRRIQNSGLMQIINAISMKQSFNMYIVDKPIISALEIRNVRHPMFQSIVKPATLNQDSSTFLRKDSDVDQLKANYQQIVFINQKLITDSKLKQQQVIQLQQKQKQKEESTTQYNIQIQQCNLQMNQMLVEHEKLKTKLEVLEKEKEEQKEHYENLAKKEREIPHKLSIPQEKKEQLQDLSSGIIQLQKQIQNLEKEREEKSKKIQQQQKTIETVVSQKIATDDVIKQKDALIQQLETTSKQQKLQSEKKVQEMENKHQILNSEIATLKIQLQDGTKQSAETQNSFQQKFQDATIQLLEKQKLIDDYIKQNDFTTKQIQGQQKEIHELNRQIQLLQVQQQDVQKSETSDVSTLQRVNRVVVEGSQEQQDQEIKKVSVEDYDRKIAEIDILKSRFEQSQLTVSNLNQDLEKMRKEIVEKQNEKEQAESKVKTIQSTFEVQISKINEAAKDAQEKLQKEMKDSKLKAEGTMQQLSNEIKELKRRNEQLSTALIEKEKLYEIESQKLEEETRRLTAELNVQLKQSEKQNVIVTITKEDQRDFSQSSQKSPEKQSFVQALQSENEELCQKVKQYELLIEKIQKELESSKQQIQELKQQNKDKDQQLSRQENEYYMYKSENDENKIITDQKEQKIVELIRQNEGIREQITRLQEFKLKYEQQSIDYQRQVDQNDKLEREKKELGEKNAQQQNYNEQIIGNQQSELNIMKKQELDARQSIIKLNKEICELSNKIYEISNELIQKDSNLNEEKVQRQKLQEEITKNNQNHEESIFQQNSIIQAKNREIDETKRESIQQKNELQQTIKEKEQQISQLEEQIQESEYHIAQLEIKGEEKDQALLEQEKRLQQCQSDMSEQMDELRNEMDSKDDIIATVKGLYHFE